MSDLHNPAPILDVKSVITQLISNTTVFKAIQAGSDPKKITQQIKPKPEQLPFCGVTLEFGEVSDNVLNSSMAQILDIDVLCTVVLQTSQDITGSNTQALMFDYILKDLMHAIYNWQPEQTRYVNGFKLNRFERIASLSDNAYEVYCVYFTIPLQIDYLDGYLTEEQKLQEIKTNILTQKLNDIKSTIVINKE